MTKAVQSSYTCNFQNPALKLFSHGYTNKYNLSEAAWFTLSITEQVTFKQGQRRTDS